MCQHLNIDVNLMSETLFALAMQTTTTTTTTFQYVKMNI